MRRKSCQAILNQKDQSITAVYDRYGMDPEKVDAFRIWGERVEAIVGGGAPGAVVPFPDRALSATAKGRVIDWRRGDRG